MKTLKAPRSRAAAERDLNPSTLKPEIMAALRTWTRIGAEVGSHGFPQLYAVKGTHGQKNRADRLRQRHLPRSPPVAEGEEIALASGALADRERIGGCVGEAG